MNCIFEDNINSAFLNYGIYENTELLEKCINDIDCQLEERPELIIFGKKCKQQRFVGFFSNDSIGYKYSNKLMESKSIPESLLKIMDDVNEIIGSEYNGVLINKYMNGNDYIGAHSDNETGLDPRCGVICISFGAERNFRIRNKNDKKICFELATQNNSIIQMSGNFQKIYTHEIPIQKKIKEPRFSLTFRKHLY